MVVEFGECERECVADTGSREQARDHRPRVRIATDVPPAKEPMTLPASIQPTVDLLSRHPVPREANAIRVGMLGLVEFGQLALVGLGVGLALVGAEAMVEVVDHLRFVEGQICPVAPVEEVAVE